MFVLHSDSCSELRFLWNPREVHDAWIPDIVIHVNGFDSIPRACQLTLPTTCFPTNCIATHVIFDEGTESSAQFLIVFPGLRISIHLSGQRLSCLCRILRWNRIEVPCLTREDFREERNHIL